ncbi:MAG: CGNR zinc finger domain-containing protein [Longimicrobiales bacterium]
MGGDVALDLVNTGSRRRDGPFRERLLTYSDLIRWAERAGIVDASAAAELWQEAERHPEEAELALDRMRELREQVYRVFVAAIRGESPPAADLGSLQAAAAEGAGARRIVALPGGAFRFGWPACERLGQLAWQVALSAAELLVSEDRTRVKECATANCNWLFVDLSRNRSRRWCDMKDCGNRAKARRHYARMQRQERRGE